MPQATASDASNNLAAKPKLKQASICLNETENEFHHSPFIGIPESSNPCKSIIPVMYPLTSRLADLDQTSIFGSVCVGSEVRLGSARLGLASRLG